MKSNGKSIKGLYTYKPNVEYTKDDLIIFDGKLYIVKDSFKGVNNQLDSAHVIDYLDQYTNTGSNSDLIRKSDFEGIFKSYIQGLSPDGVIESIQLDISDLQSPLASSSLESEILNKLHSDGYIKTGIYQVYLTTESSTKRYIFRVSNLNELVLKELLALDLSSFHMIRYKINGSGEYTPIEDARSFISTGSIVDYVSGIESFKLQLQRIKSTIESGFKFVKLIPDSNGNYTVGIGSIIRVVCSIGDTSSVEVEQYTPEFYIRSGLSSINQTLKYGVEITCNIQESDSNCVVGFEFSSGIQGNIEVVYSNVNYHE